MASSVAERLIANKELQQNEDLAIQTDRRRIVDLARLGFTVTSASGQGSDCFILASVLGGVHLGLFHPSALDGNRGASKCFYIPFLPFAFL